MIHIILLALLPVLFVLLLGYSAGKFKVIDNQHIGGLNTLLMSYALPASLFAATGSAPQQEMLAQWPFVVIVGGAMMSVYVLWYLARLYLWKCSSSEAALEALTISLPNAAAIGLPVAAALLGLGEAVPVATVIATGSLLPSPLTLALLELDAVPSGQAGVGGMRFIRAIAHAVRKPVVLAPVAGTALSLMAWPLPSLTEALLSPIGAAAGGLALFVTGLILSAQRFRFSWHGAVAAVAANLFRPALALGIAAGLHIPAATAKFAVLQAALPSGFFGILFGASYGLKTDDVGSTVIASTASAMLTLALVMSWLYG